MLTSCWEPQTTSPYRSCQIVKLSLDAHSCGSKLTLFKPLMDGVLRLDIMQARDDSMMSLFHKNALFNLAWNIRTPKATFFSNFTEWKINIFRLLNIDQWFGSSFEKKHRRELTNVSVSFHLFISYYLSSLEKAKLSSALLCTTLLLLG